MRYNMDNKILFINNEVTLIYIFIINRTLHNMIWWRIHNSSPSNSKANSNVYI